jgi:Arc/MetJ family transcription regulator
MRTTIIIKDDVLERARELTGIEEKTALIHAGLQALIEKKARERLIALGGSDPKAVTGRRRRYDTR